MPHVSLRTDRQQPVPARTLLPVAAVTWLLVLLLGLLLVL